MILDLIAKIHLFHKKHHQSFDVHAKEEAPFGVFFLAPVRKYPTGRNTHGIYLYPYMSNPRYSNGSQRRRFRARFKAMNAPCGICGGRLGEIHYDEPSDAKHPLSFVIDEIIPVSRWREFGYESPQAVASDWQNLQSAHYICNQMKSNKLPQEIGADRSLKVNLSDGEW